MIVHRQTEKAFQAAHHEHLFPQWRQALDRIGDAAGPVFPSPRRLPV